VSGHAERRLRFESSVAPGAQAELEALLRGWDVPEDGIAGEVAVLPGGASNANFTLRAEDERYVVRLAEQNVERFGIDRRRGLAAHRAAGVAGIAPELLAVKLPEGHCMARFVDGDILDATSVRRSGNLERVGRGVRALHESGEIDGRWSVFDDVRRNVEISRRENLPLPRDFSELLERMQQIEQVFDHVAPPDVLCHNDLQLQNFIVSGEKLWIVDFEYAAMGNPYFDLGGVGVNAEFTDEEEREFLAAYFGGFRPEVQARARLMHFMSALREATWAVIAAPVLELDWDYESWAVDYFDRARRGAAGGGFERRLALAAANAGAAR
jgi:thiamine kinase-like enzyme